MDNTTQPKEDSNYESSSRNKSTTVSGYLNFVGSNVSVMESEGSSMIEPRITSFEVLCHSSVPAQFEVGKRILISF